MKKRKIALLFAAFAVVGILCSCSDITNMKRDNSPKMKEKRTVEPFTGICIKGASDVHFRQGDTTSVIVVGRENAVKNVKTFVRNGELVIDWKNEGLMKNVINRSVDLYIVSPTLNSVVINGCGDFNVERRLDADSLKVWVSGTGDVKMKGVVCENIDVRLKGTGDIDIDNLACRRSSISLNGTGDIDMKQFGVERTTVDLHGVGDIDLKMDNCGTVICDLYGVGDIELSGTLRNLEKTKRGVGDIDTGGVRYIK